MNIVVNSEPRIRSVAVSDELITATLNDGRTISVPLAWSWRLSEATVEQRANYEIIGDGEGVHWKEIDEDISAEGMLGGSPARRHRKQKPSRTQYKSERAAVVVREKTPASRRKRRPTRQ